MIGRWVFNVSGRWLPAPCCACGGHIPPHGLYFRTAAGLDVLCQVCTWLRYSLGPGPVFYRRQNHSLPLPENRGDNQRRSGLRC